MPNPPNLLFILTDQQRYDTIGGLNNPVIRTPHLDRLAASGTHFERCMVPSPECVPSRCCFTHGQYPSQTGCYDNQTDFPAYGRENLMEALGRGGYHSRGIGKYHFHYADRRRNTALNGFHARDRQEEILDGPESDDYLRDLHAAGFTEIADPHGVRGDMYYFPQPAQMPARHHPTQWVGDRAVDFLEDRAGGADPWYGFVSFIHPHPPFAPPSPWHKLYRDLDIPLPHLPPEAESNWVDINRFQNRYKRFDCGRDLHRLRMIRAYYYACISFIDYQVGRILDTLEKTGADRNTLIVFASDHGELLGDFGCVGKRSYHDPAMRVPLLLRWPGQVPEGKTCRTPVSLLDVTRTFLEAAGTTFTTHSAEGENLVTQANQPDHDRIVFSQLNQGPQGLYTATSQTHKYVYSAPDQRELFFDLARDPGETTDLWSEGWALRPSVRETLGRHRDALLGLLHRTGESDATEDGTSWKSWPKTIRPDNPNADLFYQDHPFAKSLERIPGYND